MFRPHQPVWWVSSPGSNKCMSMASNRGLCDQDRPCHVHSGCYPRYTDAVLANSVRGFSGWCIESRGGRNRSREVARALALRDE
eukprot:2074962-Pyramimonas_sp.AAC.2